MNSTNPPEPSSDSVIDIPQLVRALWAGKWLVGSVAGITLASGIAYALLATPVYKAEALVQIRNNDRGSAGLGPLAAQFSDFADLSGLRLGAGSDRAVALATLKSRTLIEPFIADLGILQKMNPSAWDAEQKQWNNPNPEKRPSLWAAYNGFSRSILQVKEDRKTGLVTISVDWSDPADTQRWVTELIARTNTYLRAEAIREGETNLKYLESQASQISQVELRHSLFALMEAEHKKLMLAKGGEEFALKTIDPAPLPRKPIRPKKALIAVTSLVMGTFAGMLFVFARSAYRR